MSDFSPDELKEIWLALQYRHNDTARQWTEEARGTDGTPVHGAAVTAYIDTHYRAQLQPLAELLTKVEGLITPQPSIT